MICGCETLATITVVVIVPAADDATCTYYRLVAVAPFSLSCHAGLLLDMTRSLSHTHTWSALHSTNLSVRSSIHFSRLPSLSIIFSASEKVECTSFSLPLSRGVVVVVVVCLPVWPRSNGKSRSESEGGRGRQTAATRSVGRSVGRSLFHDGAAKGRAAEVSSARFIRTVCESNSLLQALL